MVKDKGLTCIYVVSKKPEGRSVTERPIPIQIFQTDAKTRIYWLRKWCEDRSIGVDGDVDLRDILDWDYYITRLSGCLQKIVTIPAAYQGVPNPCPRVIHPDWLQKRVRDENSGLKQMKLSLVARDRHAPHLAPSRPQPGDAAAARGDD
eukprot:gene14148-8905_t